MKKILIFAFLYFNFSNAQDTLPKSKLLHRKNEVRVDVLSLIKDSKLNLTYERFLGKKVSVGISGNSNNSNKINEDFDSGNRNTIPKYEVIPFVRYNFTTSANRYYFIELFAAANGGDFRETILLIDELNNNYYQIQKSQYSDFAIGGSLGYKFYLKERIGVELLVGFGKNLIDTDKSPDILSRVGLSLGYRF